MLSRIEEGSYQSKVLRWKKPFSENTKLHETVCDFIRGHGIKVEQE